MVPTRLEGAFVKVSFPVDAVSRLESTIVLHVFISQDCTVGRLLCVCFQVPVPYSSLDALLIEQVHRSIIRSDGSARPGF